MNLSQTIPDDPQGERDRNAQDIRVRTEIEAKAQAEATCRYEREQVRVAAANLHKARVQLEQLMPDYLDAQNRIHRYTKYLAEMEAKGITNPSADALQRQEEAKQAQAEVQRKAQALAVQTAEDLAQWRKNIQERQAVVLPTEAAKSLVRCPRCSEFIRDGQAIHTRKVEGKDAVCIVNLRSALRSGHLSREQYDNLIAEEAR
jgi:hypothetical protein